ncbi:unnamed protein product [Ambrosiozyma monospora]|uniref:Unnamed protein product n=1 Tax=Ambrosiozyma monospora TaxID=43982 RepID=A0ACB5TAH4_AMBMO|nr:unnamed protein product [Ambrosiozyma monospora]
MSDYIEYDFSKMTDTYGGFLSTEDTGPSSSTNGSNGNGNSGPSQGETLEEWKRKQEQAKLKLSLAPPPLDIANAPRCQECDSIELDQQYLQIFNCKVCKSCIEQKPDRYSLLTKTECKQDYFLTESELEDTTLFHRIIKENPHSGTFSKMQLFLRFQIEEFAVKKWGSIEKLDEEWLRREKMRVKRRDDRFNKKLAEMRKKLRAEELTRKLRGDRDKKHVHDWNEPVACGGDEQPGLVKRRCKDCGVEMEEIVF